MKYIKTILISILIISAIPTIFGQSNLDLENQDTISPKNETIAYKLNSPDEVFVLPISLKEISGISIYDKTSLACIQDERLAIYIFDLESGTVTEEIDYGKDGDFEDLEIIGQTAYLLRSDGTIYEIVRFEDKKYVLNIYNTALDKKNNTEGLAYNTDKNELLFACKDEAYISKVKSEFYRTIYSYSLQDNKIDHEPIISLNPDSVLVKLKKTKSLSTPEELSKKIDKETGKLKFKPSAIAIHPISKNLYILASVGKILIVSDLSGKIIVVEHLNKSIFKKPEGICFDPKGTMYISNEGKKGKGNILKFVYRK